MFVISGEEETKEQSTRVTVEELTEENHEGESPAEALGISLQALNGCAAYQTLVLQCQSKRVTINILVDSGSTPNFLDPKTAKQVGCALVPTNKLMVTVADGSKTCSNFICPKFQWPVQGNVSPLK